MDFVQVLGSSASKKKKFIHKSVVPDTLHQSLALATLSNLKTVIVANAADKIIKWEIDFMIYSGSWKAGLMSEIKILWILRQI